MMSHLEARSFASVRAGYSPAAHDGAAVVLRTLERSVPIVLEPTLLAPSRQPSLPAPRSPPNSEADRKKKPRVGARGGGAAAAGVGKALLSQSNAKVP